MRPLTTSFTLQVSRIVVLCFAVLITACADDIEKLKLSEEEKVRVLQLQNPFGENYVKFAVTGEAQPVLLGLQQCKVYRAKQELGVVTEWVRETALDTFYPLWSACSQEGLRQDGQYILLSFCKTPLSAGGGCAGGGGSFRSLNGKDWQLKGVNEKWGNFVNRDKAGK